ncbi:MAG: hypothetical protein AB7O98_17575 [Hyphomonadaceae bacterium]
MEDTARGLLDVLSQQGVFIGAGASLLFFMLEIFFDLGRTEKRGFFENLKSAFLLLGAAATMVFAFFSLHSQYERKTFAARAASEIVPFYQHCVAEVMALPDETRAEIVENRLDRANPLAHQRDERSVLQFECLALAVQHSTPSPGQATQIGWLAQDASLGERLLTAADDEASIAETLYRVFGVDTNEFLGIGRSLPITGDDRLSRYGEATMREYWASNGCVVTNIPGSPCDTRMQNAWGWRFSSMEQTGNYTLRQILADPDPAIRRLPDEGGDTPEYQALMRRLQAGGDLEEPTPILVRYHVFPESYYVGTLGRPEAREVFFSSLADAIDLPIREAFTRSGADDPMNLRAGAPDNRAFVWIYVPTSRDDYRLATWRNLFFYLRDVRVDERIREAARRPSWGELLNELGQD